MSRPILLDLFCKAGGAAVGYWRAGFDVIGVDIVDQPRYPFAFWKGDALEILKDIRVGDFHAIHASPPCQKYSITAALGRGSMRHGQREHPDLLPPTRALLAALGTPFIIENVVGSPMRADLTLCGTMFGLEWDGHPLFRHRWFEFGEWRALALAPASCNHSRIPVSFFGHHAHVRKGPRPDGGGPRKAMRFNSRRAAEHGMGIDWMNRAEIAEAIPPAYTEFIGRQLLRHINSRR